MSRRLAIEPIPHNDLPYPEHLNRPVDKELFRAEQLFLDRLSHLLAPEETDTQNRYLVLSGHMETALSTEMAKAALLSYGFVDQVAHSDSDISNTLGIERFKINKGRKVLLQTLWILHGEHFSQELDGFAKILTQHYGVSSKESSWSIYTRRAVWNARYVQDRDLIRSHEQSILTHLQGIYGEKNAQVFAAYYRLGDYAKEESRERHGAYIFDSGSKTERDYLTNSLEAGHAVTEHLVGLRQGSRVWSGLRGMRKGYLDKGLGFRDAYKEYEHQVAVYNALHENTSHVLSPVQREFLLATSGARIAGKTKKEAIAAFNKLHGTQYTFYAATELELVLLGDSHRDRLAELQRRKRIEHLLKSETEKRELSQELCGLVYGYHVAGSYIPELAIEFDIGETFVLELKNYIAMRISDRTDIPKRAEVTADQIDVHFEDDRLPGYILDILQAFTRTNHIDDAMSMLGEYKIKRQAAQALRYVAARIAERNEKNSKK